MVVCVLNQSAVLIFLVFAREQHDQLTAVQMCELQSYTAVVKRCRFICDVARFWSEVVKVYDRYNGNFFCLAGD